MSTVYPEECFGNVTVQLTGETIFKYSPLLIPSEEEKEKQNKNP